MQLRHSVWRHCEVHLGRAPGALVAHEAAVQRVVDVVGLGHVHHEVGGRAEPVAAGEEQLPAGRQVVGAHDVPHLLSVVQDLRDIAGDRSFKHVFLGVGVIRIHNAGVFGEVSSVIRGLVCLTHQPLFGTSFRKYVSQSVGDLESEARARPAPGPHQARARPAPGPHVWTDECWEPLR